LLDSATPSIGITNSSVEQNGNWLICRFNRQKEIPNVRNYFDLNESYFVLGSYGNLAKNTKVLMWHEKKTASENVFGFNQNSPALPQRQLSQNKIGSDSIDRTIADVSYLSV
jgi:hypothetical protein